MAMMAIKGIYAEYEVNRLNHGIGFDTAAIELLLTYARSSGSRAGSAGTGRAQPRRDPGDRGRLRGIGPFLRLGTRRWSYIRARPDVFFTGADGSLRSNRCARPPDTTPATCSSARRSRSTWPATVRRRHWAVSPAWRRPEHGGGCAGRHASPAWLKAGARHTRAAVMRAAETGRPDGRDLPRAHAAGLRRKAGRLGTGRDDRHGAAAGDDLRR